MNSLALPSFACAETLATVAEVPILYNPEGAVAEDPICYNQGGDYEEARNRLSAILSLDFDHYCFDPDTLARTLHLSTALKENAGFNPFQLAMLKMVEEIPLLIACSWTKYRDSIITLSDLQVDVSANLYAARMLDHQILQLQTRRVELANLLESKKNAMIELISAQTKIAGTLPKTSDDEQVEAADLKKPGGSAKKKPIIDNWAKILDGCHSRVTALLRIPAKNNESSAASMFGLTLKGKMKRGPGNEQTPEKDCGMRRILRGVANEVIAPSSLDGPLPNPHRPARSERCWNLITYQLPACRELFHIHFEPGSPCGCHVLNQWNKFLFTEIAQERGEYVAVNGRVGSGVNGTRWSSFSVVKFFCLCWFRFSFGYGDFLLTTQFFSDKRSDCFHFRRTQNKALFRVLAYDSSVSMAGTSKDGMYGIHDYFMQSDERQKNGAGDSVSDSGCNLELTLGGSYGDFDDEMPVLTLSSSVFESDTMEEDSGEPNVPPPAEFAVEGSFLSLGMSLPPPVLEMKTMKELQTMRRQEVKKRLMGKNRNRGRPPLPNQSQTRVLLPQCFN
ncbi:hypothetical protein CK203_031713 [Vitis vinifera]|uniref:Uncharacterized protein n=1 Tax=Vitis vinifera TaxID=29760 RepID=A0A438I3E4_VITVI|nr:hypothetical protein CK203_031713 [Vitis vinifera]